MRSTQTLVEINNTLMCNTSWSRDYTGSMIFIWRKKLDTIELRNFEAKSGQLFDGFCEKNIALTFNRKNADN